MLAYTTFLFYISSKLIPNDVKKFTIHIGNESVVFTKEENEFIADFSTGENASFKTDGGFVIANGIKMAAQSVIGDSKNWENEIPIKEPSFGTTISIKRNANTIFFFQEKGIFSTLNASVKW